MTSWRQLGRRTQVMSMTKTDGRGLRTVVGKYPAYRDDIGDLVTRRPLPGPGLDQIDPFLFLNHHGPQTYPPGNCGLPFGPHPHRGFETVTFILAGNLAHYDSGGNASVIEAGGVQWMTSGSGLVHAEVSPPEFKAQGGPLEILQLWVNLPSRLKMTAPAYSGIQAHQIPAIEIGGGGARLNLISGQLQEQAGPIRTLTGVFMSTVLLPTGAEVELAAPRGRNVFLYVVRGSGEVSDTQVERWELIRMSDECDLISVKASADMVLLFGHADAIRQPVVAHGPFVMNTREEIHQAIADYQSGKFNGTGELLQVGH